MHDHRDFFLTPNHPTQRQYEALRAFYVDHLPAQDIAQRFGWSLNYFKNLRSQFHQLCVANTPPQFFLDKHPGPSETELPPAVKQAIITLRKKAYSIQDIQTVLHAQGTTISL